MRRSIKRAKEGQQTDRGVRTVGLDVVRDFVDQVLGVFLEGQRTILAHRFEVGNKGLHGVFQSLDLLTELSLLRFH
jgi:hypothetical protein